MQTRAVIYGFSRGGQTANRFALAFPRRVSAAAILSAGTYTVPAETDRTGGLLPFPFGVGNLREVIGASFDRAAFDSVRFWLGVGAEDSDPSETPAEWDPYIGAGRLERADRFAAWVRGVGGTAETYAFRGLGHTETDAERASALRFLAASV